MDEILALRRARITPLRSWVTALVEREGERPLPIPVLDGVLSQLVEACRRLVVEARARPRDEEELFASILPHVEGALEDVRAVRSALADAIERAYRGEAAEANLCLDSLLERLQNGAAAPLETLHAELRTGLERHVEKHPWDASLLRGGDEEGELLERSLDALAHGDDFDIEDAVEALTGPLRHRFMVRLDRLSAEQDELAGLRERFWKRPEIVIANDYWRHGRGERIVERLSTGGGSAPGSGFAEIASFFAAPSRSGPHQRPEELLASAPPRNRNRYLRCLVLHPDRDVRSYAAANIDGTGFWKCLSVSSLPCASILTMLERVALSRRFDEHQRRIFFDAVHKRLLRLSSRSETLYARGIVRIFTTFDFLVEDGYFDKLSRLIDYLRTKEAAYRLGGSLLDESIAELLRTKRKVGSRETRVPDFGSVPLVILRKLAREGHFTTELAKHPIAKIACETLPYINTPEKAQRVVLQKQTNQEVLRALGRRKSFFRTSPARIALLSNPRTPPAISMEYLADLDRHEVNSLLRKSTVHPELRRLLVERYRSSNRA